MLPVNRIRRLKMIYFWLGKKKWRKKAICMLTSNWESLYERTGKNSTGNMVLSLKIQSRWAYLEFPHPFCKNNSCHVLKDNCINPSPLKSNKISTCCKEQTRAMQFSIWDWMKGRKEGTCPVVRVTLAKSQTASCAQGPRLRPVGATARYSLSSFPLDRQRNWGSVRLGMWPWLIQLKVPQQGLGLSQTSTAIVFTTFLSGQLIGPFWQLGFAVEVPLVPNSSVQNFLLTSPKMFTEPPSSGSSGRTKSYLCFMYITVVKENL